MNEEVKNYTVISANWEIEVDSISHKNAAIDACLFAFCKYKNELLMSTTIMVYESLGKKDLQSSEFFATYDIFSQLGLNSKSQAFYELTKTLNES